MQKVKIMYNVERTYNLDDEKFEDLYVDLGTKGTKSKEEPMNLV
jgi:hypothetical protein